MKIWGVLVTHNEMGRYLDCVVSWHRQFLDGIAAYDDRSTDGTADYLAEAKGVQVTIRPATEPGFRQHEGRFRQQAWEWFERVFSPTEGDWVLAFDADEMTIARDGEREALEAIAQRAEVEKAVAAVVHIPEVYRADEMEGLLDQPYVRTDGFWGQIKGTRFFRYLPNGHIADRQMACGSEPTYVGGSARFVEQKDLVILHYGYADPLDRMAKYERYRTLYAGHNVAHVNSIVGESHLEMWAGPYVPVWRGKRERVKR